MTFWDFCAPFYDIAEKTNDRVYKKMLATVRENIPLGSTVMEAAAGTGSISLAVADRAGRILCTDLSERMLRIARRKGAKHPNITFAIRSIYDLREPDSSFDVVVAGQVLHLLDEPNRAAEEMRRVAGSMVILPMSFTKNLKGFAKFGVNVYRLFGFAPRFEFDAESYAEFLPSIGFSGCDFIPIPGNIPMVAAIWRKQSNN